MKTKFQLDKTNTTELQPVGRRVVVVVVASLRAYPPKKRSQGAARPKKPKILFVKKKFIKELIIIN
jgi:hypothetical protein